MARLMTVYSDAEIVEVLEEVIKGINDRSMRVSRMRVEHDFQYADMHDLDISLQAHVIRRDIDKTVTNNIQ